MESDRWRRVDTLFHAALGRPAGERAAFLAEACGGDEAVRRDVASLLEHEAKTEGFLTSLPAADTPVRDDAGATARPPEPTQIGRYRVLRKLGEGGMGVVYAALDESLGRHVALKVLRGDSVSRQARQRLVREARVAASVSHPLICQVFELGEWAGQPFIAMELLSGESLATRLRRGALPPAEAVRLALLIAEALSVLHAHGLVHRDLKPSNIFVSDASLKVLDFGLARPVRDEDRETVTVTQAGTVVGTPQYAAPEQLTGSAVDGRADLFSLGVILFEMLAGRPPFTGRTIAAVLHALLYETPPVLTGSAAITAVDRVLHRALAKPPAQRHPNAAALAADLRAAAALPGSDRVAETRPILRLAVLPFRLLNPDRDIDYLAMSFADALVSALSGFESLVVRSSLQSARFANGPPDLEAVAAQLAVDIVLTGSILRQGDRLRVAAELVSVPAGDVRWNHTAHVAIGNVFDAHEELARRVVASLPLAPRDQDRQAARPTSTKAFDLYLRGMQLRMETSSWRQARAFFEQCLALDAAFAPAWAERGRLDRILGKYEDPAHFAQAEAAFERALEIDPDNGPAQHYFAQLEVDLGRADAALMRLIERVRQRRAEPQVFAAIVHASRYVGLLDVSIAADERARELDPAAVTGVLHTYYMQGDYERAMEEGHRTSDPFEARVLGAMGRRADAIAAARREEERFAAIPRLRGFSTGLRAALEGGRDEALDALRPFDALGFRDGEGLFYIAQIYTMLGATDRARTMLERAVDAGFVCVPAFERDPYLEPLRRESWWKGLADRAETRHAAAVQDFTRAGGRPLLGLA